MFIEVLNEIIVSDLATLFEPKPRLIYLCIDESFFINNIVEIVVVNDALWDGFDVEFDIFGFNKVRH